MKNKLLFLTKISINKKIKTKWFLLANIIFAILIIGLINIDTIIKTFGGDFNENQEILVIDEAGVFNEFNSVFSNSLTYIEDYEKINLINYNKDYETATKEVEDEEKILLVISKDENNYIKAKLVSKEGIGTITDTIINTTLTTVRSNIALSNYNITKEMLNDINNKVAVESIILDADNIENDLTIASIMQIITLPLFMLIIFLVQMIGAEVNEEKATKSMEIIISNVSPKTHFLSKIISANLFVIIQGLLLILFMIVGIIIRFIITDGNLIGSFGTETEQLISSLSLVGVLDTLNYMIPIIIIMTLLTFLAYSLLAGILASMTTNLEDFQQLQTPIVIISLVGYYLAIMASMFKGSIFIKIMSFIPFISSLLAPTMYVLGEITLLDLSISIGLLILIIYILIKYGLKIYKVGILNYKGFGLWKKIFKAIKEK